MISDKELIIKLQTLKQIKPRENWAVFAKNNIFAQPAVKASWYEQILSTFASRKLAYAFAALAILVAGSLSFMGLPGKSGVPQASPAALAGAKNSVESFKEKSKELSMAAQMDEKTFSAAVDNVKTAAKQLTETIQKDPGVAKEIALEINNNKTYLNVEGSAELETTLDDMYKNTVQPVIEDLESNLANLTKSQQEALDIAKALYEQGRYTDALESILLLSMAIKNN